MKHTHTPLKFPARTTNRRGTSEAQVNEYVQVFAEGNFNLFRGCNVESDEGCIPGSGAADDILTTSTQLIRNVN